MLGKQRRRRSYAMVTFIFISLFLFLMMQGLLYFERILRPAILSVAAIEAELLATSVVNRAILEHIMEGIFYEDLITVEKDVYGRIMMARLNTMEVNRLLAETTLAVYDAMDFLEKTPFHIPLGEVLGSYLLATYGPRIPIRLIPMGRVSTEVTDLFEEAGINQTRHKLYLTVHAQVHIIVPFIAEPMDIHTTVPIVDTIFIGEVPDVFLNLQFPSHTGSFN